MVFVDSCRLLFVFVHVCCGFGTFGVVFRCCSLLFVSCWLLFAVSLLDVSCLLLFVVRCLSVLLLVVCCLLFVVVCCSTCVVC